MFSETQKGLSLIEVLLAWAMIAIFLSSAMWLQVEFLKKYRDNREKMIAQWQIESMAERLLANKTTVARIRELHYWSEQNKTLFRNAKSELYCSENTCEVRLFWGRNQKIQLWV